MNEKEFDFTKKKRVVVKIGSSSLNRGETGNLNFTKLEHLVRELCDMRNRGMDVCLVSSGAIAVGRQTIGLNERPKDISTKQACAAVGQARLMMTYQRMFAEYNQIAGQILMTKNTMVNPVSRKNAKNTFEELFRLGVIPIVNENDTVSTYEMQFGDNDTLSAIVSSLVGADLLILLSDIDYVEDLELKTSLWINNDVNRAKTTRHEITSLKGLEYFSSLRRLKLVGNRTDTLECIPDFSRFKELRELEIIQIYLPKLDISGCKNLTNLSCRSCDLNTIDLKKNIQLRTLDCTYNRLIELDLSHNKQLRTVIVKSQRNKGLLSEGGRAGILSKLILPDNRSNTEGISILECSDNNLEKLDISRSPHLRKINCSWNKLKALETSHNQELRELKCEANYIGELDFSANLKMEFLTCGLQGYEWIRQEGNDYRLLKKLILPEQKENVEGGSLRKLSIKEISEEAIPVFSDYPYLKELNCADNRLKTIDLSANIYLEVLDCSSNAISQLDLHSNVNLYSLNILNCPLQVLDLSQTKVKLIMCDFYDRREKGVKNGYISGLYLKLIVPKGYHAETINFRTPTLETASFENGSIYNYLPPQYVRMVVSGK